MAQTRTRRGWLSRLLQSMRPVAVLALLIIVAVQLSVGFLLWSLRVRELRHAEIETVNLTRMLMEQTQQNFEAADLVLQGIQERMNTAFGRQLELDSNAVHLLLTTRLGGARLGSSMFILDAEGTLVNSSLDNPPRGLDLTDRDYFQAWRGAGRPSLFISHPTRNRINQAWTMYLSRPLLGGQGDFRGVVVVAMQVAAIEKAYAAVQLGYVRPMALYTADGSLIASLPHREAAIGLPAAELTGQQLPTETNQLRSIRHAGGDGEHQVYVVGRMQRYPLLFSVINEEGLSLAAWRETAIPIGLGAILLCIFTVLVAVYLIGKLQHREALARALDAADARYQHTINSVMDAIVAVDESMRIVMFNPSAEAMFGWAAADVLGQQLDVLIPPRLRDNHDQKVRNFAASGAEGGRMAPGTQVFGRRADGSEFPVETTVSHSRIGGELQMTAVLRDASERRRTEAELRQANAQLRELSASLQRVREEERTRISRELHDDLGQQLTGLKLSLSWLGTRVRSSKTLEVGQIDEMRHQLDGTIASVRRIAAELRPRLLDDLEFGEALEWQIRDFFKHSHLQCQVELEGAERVRDDTQATALFRIVQEALTNVVRHANATQVKVVLRCEQQTLLLTIQDDGLGFDPGRRAGGVGVVGMRERCSGIGAQFSIESALGAGTTVTVALALSTLQDTGEPA